MSEIRRLKEEMIEIGRRSWLKGFIASNDGNFSVRTSSGLILATASGVSKGFLKPDMILLLDDTGRVQGKTSRAVSSEIKMHLMCYRERPDIRSVVHCHPPCATAFALIGKDIGELYLPEAVAFLGRIRVAPYALPSTPELAEGLAPFVRESDTVLMERHGALCLGDGLLAAYHRLETLEHSLNILLLARQIGHPSPLSEEQVAALMRIREKAGMPGKVLI